MSSMVSTPGRRATTHPVAARRPRLSPRARRIGRETLVIVLAALVYFLVRGLMHTQVAVAFANAETLIAFEQRLGLFHEPAMQGWITGDQTLVDLANRVYIFGHWPVIAGTMLYLALRHGEHLARYRTALLLSGAIGFVFFLTVPMAPPRMLVEHGFVDTVTQHSEAYRVLQPPAFTNQYAAMPSLHVGWNLLMGIALVRHAQTAWLRAFGWVMPLGMWLATIVTANHYVVDGVVGAAVALTGLGLAIWIGRRRERNAVTGATPALTPGRAIGQGWSQRPAA